MTTHKHSTRRLLLIVSLSFCGFALLALALTRLEKNLVYYVTPSQILTPSHAISGRKMRLGGLVRPHSVHWDSKGLQLQFQLTEHVDSSSFVDVQAQGAPPQMFQEGMGAVVEGEFDGKIFHADRVLVKHSNEYRPPEPGERPEELYKTLLTEP
jgi:cytochrome c-type biogenesis protein CcmE